MSDDADTPTTATAEPHPEFTKFKNERLQDPAIKAAYDEAVERRATAEGSDQ